MSHASNGAPLQPTLVPVVEHPAHLDPDLRVYVVLTCCIAIMAKPPHGQQQDTHTVMGRGHGWGQ
eukprot:7731771-Alexandrium_andersonii.AAC.1